MIIRKTIVAITIASLIAQPAIGSGTIVKTARLGKIAQLVGKNETAVANFIKGQGFKPQRGGYYTPAVIQAVKNEFTPIIPATSQFDITQAKVDTWLSKTEIITPATTEVDEFAQDSDAFTSHDLIAQNSELTTAQLSELIEWYAAQYGELNHKALRGIKHVVSDYLAIVKDAAYFFNFGTKHYYKADSFIGNQLADQMISKLKAMTKSFKDTMTFVAANVDAENKDLQTFLINPYINQFNKITADAIKSFEESSRSEVTTQTFIAAMRAAYRSLINNLNKVNDLVQRKAADFVKSGKEYATQAGAYADQATTYAANNPKKAHALFATTVASVTGRAMASAQEKEKAAKKARLAAIPTVENIATTFTQPSAITPTEVVATKPIVIDHELEQAKKSLAEADMLYAAQLEIAKLEAAEKASQPTRMQKLYNMLPNNPMPTIKQVGTKVVDGVKTLNPAKYIDATVSTTNLPNRAKAIKEAGLSAMNWIANLRPGNVTKMLGYNKVDAQ